MSLDKNDLRIGELLIKAEILTRKDLDESMKTTRTTGLPVGRVLIMSGCVTEQEFQAAVQAQSLIRDGLVPLDTAIEALSELSNSQVSFDEALHKVGWKQDEDKESNKLGELLLASEVVPGDQLETAMRTSQATGLPLGRLLISLGTLSDEVLATALTAQSLIRSGNITREQGVAGLNAAHLRRSPVELSLKDQGYMRGPNRPTVRLGDLLVNAALVSENQVMDALQKSLVEQKWLGRVLVEADLLTPMLLSDALNLQEMVANETLSIDQATKCLRRLNKTNSSKLSEVISTIEIPEEEFKTLVRYHEVLRVAGLIGQPEMDKVKVQLDAHHVPSFKDAFLVAEALLNKEILDDRTYYGSLRCFFLIAIGWLNMQQGIIALNYFHHRKCSFDEVLQELNWTIKTHVREVDTADKVPNPTA